MWPDQSQEGKEIQDESKKPKIFSFDKNRFCVVVAAFQIGQTRYADYYLRHINA